SRPQNFRLNPRSPLARGLVFAGLGQGCAGTPRFYDSCAGVIHAGNHGTLTNMAPPTDWVFSPELGRWALDFDGTNDHVLAGQAGMGIQSQSVSAWVSTTAANQYTGLCGKCNITANGFEWTVYDYTELALAYYDGAVRGWYHVECNIPADTQTHLCGTWDQAAGKFRAYKNGVYIGFEDTTTGTIVHSAAEAFAIGAVNDTGLWPWAGQLTDLCLYNRVLSSSEISALADPSNVMLAVGGVPLIEPVGPSWLPVAVAGQTYNLTASACTHAHAAETPAITQVHALAAEDATHAHAGDTPAITQVHVLAAEDATHAHAADTPAITQLHALAAEDAAHAQAAETPILTQLHKMIAAACAHAHAADSPVLSSDAETGTPLLWRLPPRPAVVCPPARAAVCRLPPRPAVVVLPAEDR
ncbi:MAG TPA: LamG domain-containing protein, partial [Phycisphaerae bacterium]|nr:LamG domain-containing protein [Phycisphaerae bacterium]